MDRSLLSDKAILRHIENKTIIIEPFNNDHLSTSSYDVTLGPYYYREKDPEPGRGIYNPYSKNDVDRVWGEFQEAELVSSYLDRVKGVELENISLDDRLNIKYWINFFSHCQIVGLFGLNQERLF